MATRRAKRTRVAAAATGLVLAGLAQAALPGPPAGAAVRVARATLVSQDGSEVGTVVFLGRGRHADRVEVELALPAGAPGLGAYHGLHVHATGSCTGTFTGAGGHWNPTGRPHGHHAGDLPSVLVSGEGGAAATFETDRFAVADLFDGDGSAVVLHAGPDNFANVPAAYGGPNPATLAAGDAGPRYACGVVARP